MKKTFRKQQDESQIIWKNVEHDAGFNPNKLTKYYGVVKVGDKSFITEYEARFRSEAKTILEEDARMVGGKLDFFGIYK